MVQQTNSCGACRACCYSLTIKTTGDEEQDPLIRKWITEGKEEKQPPKPCPQMLTNKMKVGGCSIHNEPTKPSLCNDYLCAYALGYFGTEINIRPDRTGVIIDLLEGKVRITEIEPKSLEKPLVKRLIWASQQIVLENKKEDWFLEIIPYNLMGSGLGTKTPIIPADKLSIGNKK